MIGFLFFAAAFCQLVFQEHQALMRLYSSIGINAKRFEPWNPLIVCAAGCDPMICERFDSLSPCTGNNIVCVNGSVVRMYVLLLFAPLACLVVHKSLRLLLP
jgi:hypothetical protein